MKSLYQQIIVTFLVPLFVIITASEAIGQAESQAEAQPEVERQTQDLAEDIIEFDRQQFNEAVALLDEERYAEALEAFEALQIRRPHPTIVYNLGWCLMTLGRYEEARERFEQYLQSDNSSPSRRERVESELRRIETLLPERPPPEPEQREFEEPPSENDQELQIEAPRRRRLRPGWFWASLGITLATGAALIGTGTATLSLSDRWLEEGDINDRDRGRTFVKATNALLIATIVEAIASLIVGLVSDFTTPQSHSGPEELSLLMIARGGG